MNADQDIAVEWWPLGRPKPHPENPRLNDQAVEYVAASIERYGFRQPITVDADGVIITGHTRLKAAERLGWAVVPVIVCADLSGDEAAAYRIADNASAAHSEFDNKLLVPQLQDLTGKGFDGLSLGFDPDTLAGLLTPKTSGLNDPDEVPEVEEPVSVLGDVWVLGRHRIACGDSCSADDVERLLGEVRPHLMVTDPPYGVEYDASWRKAAGVGGDGAATGKVLNDDRADWREAWALFPGHVAYVWHAGLFGQVVAESLIACGFQLRSQIIWKKSTFALSRANYHWEHEPCLYVGKGGEPAAVYEDGHETAAYAVKKGKTANWKGGRKQSTVWEIEKPRKSETGHSTQKPVECMARPIRNNSSEGQAVYEPFSGSGTTIIACEMEGRSAFAMELNPAYVDVAVRRWEAFTGQTAVLEETGESFAAVADARAA